MGSKRRLLVEQAVDFFHWKNSLTGILKITVADMILIPKRFFLQRRSGCHSNPWRVHNGVGLDKNLLIFQESQWKKGVYQSLLETYSTLTNQTFTAGLLVRAPDVSLPRGKWWNLCSNLGFAFINVMYFLHALIFGWCFSKNEFW